MCIRDSPKTEPLPPPTLEKLEPFDQRRVLTSPGIVKDVEACRVSAGALRGAVALVKMKVDGATGRVLEMSPADTSAAARCIAKSVKSKVKFDRFKQKTQEFVWRFSL